MRPKQLVERIEKLPQWAQRYITKLEKDVEHWKAQFETAEAGDSPIQWRIKFNETRGLPARTTVSFATDDGDKIEVSLRRGKVNVRGYTGSLIIRPVTSNAAILSTQR